MKQITTKLWVDTLEAIRQIKELTRETHVLILHRLVIAELERLKLEQNRRKEALASDQSAQDQA